MPCLSRVRSPHVEGAGGAEPQGQEPNNGEGPGRGHVMTLDNAV
jgi:hypothetical protein